MTSLPKVQMSVVNGEIAGFCDPRFERVAEAFARNFQDRNEVGASVCIKMGGEPVVDLQRSDRSLRPYPCVTRIA